MEMATTSPPRGAGNESAASGTVIARRPAAPSIRASSSDAAMIVEARAAAWSWSMSRRSRRRSSAS